MALYNQVKVTQLSPVAWECFITLTRTAQISFQRSFMIFDFQIEDCWRDFDIYCEGRIVIICWPFGRFQGKVQALFIQIYSLSENGENLSAMFLLNMSLFSTSTYNTILSGSCFVTPVALSSAFVFSPLILYLKFPTITLHPFSS